MINEELSDESRDNRIAKRLGIAADALDDVYESHSELEERDEFETKLRDEIKERQYDDIVDK